MERVEAHIYKTIDGKLFVDEKDAIHHENNERIRMARESILPLAWMFFQKHPNVISNSPEILTNFVLENNLEWIKALGILDAAK
jgi:hypothetical protein